MLGNFLRFSLFLLVCAAFILTGYNTFLLPSTLEVLPLFLFAHLGLLLLLGVAVYLLSERAPLMKLVICLVLSFVIVFLNSLVSSFPPEEHELKVEIYREEVKKINTAISDFYGKTKRLPENLEELVKADPALKDIKDPFSFPEKPFTYTKPDKTKFLLYSVGPDNKDDGGKVKYDVNFNMRSYMFPWDSLFFGDWMRSKTDLKGRHLGDIVTEGEIDPKKGIVRTGHIVKIR